MNDFRANPSSVPLTQEQLDQNLEVGTSQLPYQWSDELYELALEHTRNMAADQQISHEGVSERFDRVTQCQWSGYSENVAYNMEEGDDALHMVITQWGESAHGHRENMLDADKDYAAVAIVSNGQEVYFTGKFMSCFD